MATRTARIDRRTWRVLETLDDDRLLTMLGSPTYSVTEGGADQLLFRVEFAGGREAIKRGKRRLARLAVGARRSICARWRSLKGKPALKRAEVVALVAEVVGSMAGVEVVHVLPTTILICRACDYSLGKLCKAGATP